MTVYTRKILNYEDISFFGTFGVVNGYEGYTTAQNIPLVINDDDASSGIVRNEAEGLRFYLDVADCDFLAFINPKCAKVIVEIDGIAKEIIPLGQYALFSLKSWCIPPGENRRIHVLLMSLNDGSAFLGSLFVPQKTFLGKTKTEGFSIKSMDFSKIIRSDIDGSLTLKKGNSLRKINTKVITKNESEIIAFLMRIIGTNCFFATTDNINNTKNIMFGVVREYEFTPISENRAEILLEVEELIFTGLDNKIIAAILENQAQKEVLYTNTSIALNRLKSKLKTISLSESSTIDDLLREVTETNANIEAFSEFIESL